MERNTLQRLLTAAPTRTMTLGTTRHSRRELERENTAEQQDSIRHLVATKIGMQRLNIFMN